MWVLVGALLLAARSVAAWNAVLPYMDERILQEMKEKHSVNEIVAHGDLVDQSNDYSERELLLGMAEHDRSRLLSINEALSKIDEGTYGTCTACGEEIPEARLLALPTAKNCIKCQSASEGYG